MGISTKFEFKPDWQFEQKKTCATNNLFYPFSFCCKTTRNFQNSRNLKYLRADNSQIADDYYYYYQYKSCNPEWIGVEIENIATQQPTTLLFVSLCVVEWKMGDELPTFRILNIFPPFCEKLHVWPKLETDFAIHVPSVICATWHNLLLILNQHHCHCFHRRG